MDSTYFTVNSGRSLSKDWVVYSFIIEEMNS